MNSRQMGISGIAILIGYLFIGCSSPTDTSSRDESVIRPAEHVFELTCRESAQFLAVDPVKARAHVPTRYTVYTTGQPTADASSRLIGGKAVFIIIYQECTKATWDGQPLAPLKMLHQWVRIEGPDEIIPVPGTATTVPTYYWYMLDDQTTHTTLREKLREAGITSSKIDSIELGHDIDGIRTGRIIEKDRPGTNSDVGYSFVEHNRSSEQIPIGINHRLFHEECRLDGQCTLMKALDSGFIIPFGSGSPVRVTAHPEASVAKLWDTTTLLGVATQFEQMEFKVTINAGIPPGNDKEAQVVGD